MHIVQNITRCLILVPCYLRKMFLLLFLFLTCCAEKEEKLEFKSGEMSSVYASDKTAESAFDGHLNTNAHSNCNREGVKIWMRLSLSGLAVVTKVTVWPTHLTSSGYKLRFDGTKVYVRAHGGVERYCGAVTIPNDPDISSDIICENPIIGTEIVFRQQKEDGEEACIHVFEVEAYGFKIRNGK